MTIDEPELTVAQMSAATGMSSHTLRYYERAGLIRPITRNSANQRRYSAADVAWVEFLLRLRQTGMPIAQMREYAELRARGSDTIEARLRLLVAHQIGLQHQIANLQTHEAALAAKIAFYRADLTTQQTPQQNGTHHV